MARIRSIKPEFWTDAKTGTLSEFAKCLLIGLLNHSDDYGVIEFSEMEFRARIFPYHSDTTTGTVRRALVDELFPRKLVSMFSMTDDYGDTKRYLFITTFPKHQVVNKPSKPLIAQWKVGDTPKTYTKKHDLAHEGLTVDGVVALREYSGSTTSWKGKERKGKEDNSVKDASSDEPASTDDDDEATLGPPKIIDPGKVLFDEGVKLFSLYGVNVRNSRSIIAKWQKQHGTQTVLNAVLNAGKSERHDVIAFIEGSFRAIAPPRSNQSGSRAQQAQRFLQEVLNDAEDDRKQVG